MNESFMTNKNINSLTLALIKLLNLKNTDDAKKKCKVLITKYMKQVESLKKPNNMSNKDHLMFLNEKTLQKCMDHIEKRKKEKYQENLSNFTRSREYEINGKRNVSIENRGEFTNLKKNKDKTNKTSNEIIGCISDDGGNYATFNTDINDGYVTTTGEIERRNMRLTDDIQKIEVDKNVDLRFPHVTAGKGNGDELMKKMEMLKTNYARNNNNARPPEINFALDGTDTRGGMNTTASSNRNMSGQKAGGQNMNFDDFQGFDSFNVNNNMGSNFMAENETPLNNMMNFDVSKEYDKRASMYSNQNNTPNTMNTSNQNQNQNQNRQINHQINDDDQFKQFMAMFMNVMSNMTQNSKQHNNVNNDNKNNQLNNINVNNISDKRNFEDSTDVKIRLNELLNERKKTDSIASSLNSGKKFDPMKSPNDPFFFEKSLKIINSLTKDELIIMSVDELDMIIDLYKQIIKKSKDNMNIIDTDIENEKKLDKTKSNSIPIDHKMDDKHCDLIKKIANVSIIIEKDTNAKNHELDKNMCNIQKIYIDDIIFECPTTICKRFNTLSFKYDDDNEYTTFEFDDGDYEVSELISMLNSVFEVQKTDITFNVTNEGNVIIKSERNFGMKYYNDSILKILGFEKEIYEHTNVYNSENIINIDLNKIFDFYIQEVSTNEICSINMKNYTHNLITIPIKNLTLTKMNVVLTSHKNKNVPFICNKNINIKLRIKYIQ